METQVETSALVLFEAQPIANLFKPETNNPILEKIAIEVRAPKFDITKEPDRKACASLAFKLAKTRTFIDSCRLKLVADEKKRLKAIDAEGSRIWDELESLQKEVRKPLTDWEDAEKARVIKHEEHIARLELSLTFLLPPTTEDIRERIAIVESDDLVDMREFTDRAKIAKDLSLGALRQKLAASEKADADRAELERDAEVAAERKIQEAKDREAKAEAARIAEIEQAKRAAADKAKADKIAAEQKAKRDQEAAVQREKDRVAAEKKAEEAAAAKREANKKHVAKINSEAMTALVTAGLEVDAARTAIQCIVAGKVPNVTITY